MKIIVVELGNDAVRFVNDGYHVIDATNQSDPSLYLRFDNEDLVETVSTARMYEEIDEFMSVLLAYVWGEDLTVFQGSACLLRDSIKSLWIEGIACNELVLHILEFLDTDFVLFDQEVIHSSFQPHVSVSCMVLEVKFVHPASNESK